MPNIYFYAFGDDAAQVLDAIFADMRLDVWPGYSPRSDTLASFSAAREAIEYLRNQAHVAIFFLHRDSLGAPVIIRDRHGGAQPSDDLPKRFSVEGWGVFQLNFLVGRDSVVGESSIGVRSEAFATTWRDTLSYRMGDPSAWRWVEVKREYASLRRLLERLSVARVQGAYILPDAYERIVNGGAQIDRDVSQIVETRKVRKSAAG